MMEDSDLLAYGCRRVLFKFNKRKKGRDLIHRDEFLGDFQSYSQFLEFCIFKRLWFFQVPKSKHQFCVQEDQTIRELFIITNREKVSSWSQYTFQNQLVYFPLKRMMVSLAEKHPTKETSKGEKEFDGRFQKDSLLSDNLRGAMKNGIVTQLISNCEISPIMLEFLWRRKRAWPIDKEE